MTNLMIFSALLGAVLGMRLRVLILIPAIGLFVIGIVGIGTARGEELSLIASAVVLTAICQQLGYLAGSTTRFVMAAARAGSRDNRTAIKQQGGPQTVRR